MTDGCAGTFARQLTPSQPQCIRIDLGNRSGCAGQDENSCFLQGDDFSLSECLLSVPKASPVSHGHTLMSTCSVLRKDAGHSTWKLRGRPSELVKTPVEPVALSWAGGTEYS